MNLNRIKAVLDARYESNPDDRRVLRLRRKINRALGKQARAERRGSPVDREQAEAHARNLRSRLINAIDSGKRIVAVDTEWMRDGSRKITEIGVAIYQNGELTLRNIRVIPDFNTDFDNFRGTTEFMTDDDAAAVFEEIQASADMIAGHALKNDRLQFKRWRKVHLRDDNVFDTQSYAKSAHGEILSLGNFLRLLDITPKGMHSAGNDAYYVMMALLTIAGRTDESRALGAKPLNPRREAWFVRNQALAKANEKLAKYEETTDEERERKQRPSISVSAIRVGASYLGRDLEDYPRRVERIVEVDQPRAPSGKATIVYFRKRNGKQKALSLTNFSHWAIEEIDPAQYVMSGVE
jgi:hypothetical protein